MSAPIPESEHFVYRDGELHADGVALRAIADRMGTPTFVYSWKQIAAAVGAIDRALGDIPHRIAYAMKANSNLHLLRRLGELGCGADIVSGGELARALKAGIPASEVVFSGVGKTDTEIEAALKAGVSSLHAESAAELDAIEAIAARLGLVAPVSMRVNPDVDPKTHPYIATGLRAAKFGIEMDAARSLIPRILGSQHLDLEGLACHIGSQMADAKPLREAVHIVGKLACDAAEQGARLRSLDAGGGWPISYGDEGHDLRTYAQFGKAIHDGLASSGADKLGLHLTVEPGRCVVGDAGVLLTQVVYVKEQPDKRFAIVDGAMTELLRPALYQAYHAMLPVRAPQTDAAYEAIDVVGPVCESGDFLAKDRPMPPLKRGDLLAVRGAGAYSATMSSNYNSRPRAPEVLVDGDDWQVIREREQHADLWQHERM